MTPTSSMIRATADAQVAATTKAAIAEGARDLPFFFVVAGLEKDTATTANGNGQDTVRRVLSVEARVRLSAQDEEFDVSLIRDEDLLS